MNKTAQTELHRLFLIDRLPEPLTPASSHLQIFDNYIANTRLRLRQVRDPQSNTWTRILQSRHVRVSTPDAGYAATKIEEIHLTDAEYAVFERFEGREIRKNRYFHEFDRVPFAFDVYLGELWGLNSASGEFDSLEHLEAFLPPPFVRFEVTNDPFFDGANLVDKKFADIQAEVAKIGPLARAVGERPDE
jgi:CYTH domain-containing protein